MKSYLYLAGPYSHKSLIVREQRFKLLTKKAAELMIAGHIVFSPITHGHAIAEHNYLSTDFEWWKNQCSVMLQNSEIVAVLQLDGWRESIGVNYEIELAKEYGIPVEYIK